MAKKKNEVACVEQANPSAKAKDSQNKSVVAFSDNEKAKKIAELKKNTDQKKIAEYEKELASIIKKPSAENEVFVSLNEEEKKMVAQWRERVSKAQKNPIVYTYTLDDEGKEIGEIEIGDGYPVSPTDKWEVYNAAINLATGSLDMNFGFHIFSWCLLASGFSKPGKKKGDNYTAIISAMQALKPQDEIEGMLVSRLIALHFQSMKSLSCSGATQSEQEVDIYINRATKLSRLYNETLEALMRYRRKGEQKVVVQHVNVNDGGKAIVGNFQAGGNNS